MNKVLLIAMACAAFAASAQDNINQYYPYRVPDWLWKDQLRSIAIDSATKARLEKKIVVMDSAYAADNNILGDQLELEINYELGKNLSLLDLTRGSRLVHSKSNGTLALQLDPHFRTQNKDLLTEAAALFLEIALDEKVISEAYKNSVELPEPLPEMYTSGDAAIGQRTYTDDYARMLRLRSRPFSTRQFRIQMQGALSTPTGDPALLVISSYFGNVWWGGAWYNYFNSSSQRLSRFDPTNGFLYIRLNKDSLAVNRSVPFWASKIAHESLHNLGYWHPIYNDPAERDRNNVGAKKAFIVAYELAILSRAKKVYAAKRKGDTTPATGTSSE